MGNRVFVLISQRGVGISCEHASRPFPDFGANRRDQGLEWNVGVIIYRSVEILDETRVVYFQKGGGLRFFFSPTTGRMLWKSLWDWNGGGEDVFIKHWMSKCSTVSSCEWGCLVIVSWRIFFYLSTQLIVSWGIFCMSTRLSQVDMSLIFFCWNWEYVVVCPFYFHLFRSSHFRFISFPSFRWRGWSEVTQLCGNVSHYFYFIYL